MHKLNTAEKTIGEIVSEYPQTARVFERHSLDYCCGGGRSLKEACQDAVKFNTVVRELEEEVASPSDSDETNWSKESLVNLCEHIEGTHHAYLREELPRLTRLVEKVARVHGDRLPELRELESVFGELRNELEPHMMKEEQILFPAIRHMEGSSSLPQFAFGTVENPINMMEHEHDNAGDALAKIRDITSGYEPPEDACNTYRVMLDCLKRLERDMHQHIHKENNILFPRAMELEAAKALA